MVDEVARRLGLPQPLDERDRWIVEQALTDAQADLEAYLGRPVTPQIFTDTGMLPVGGQYRLKHSPVLEIVSTTAETGPDGTPTGYFTVVYTAGLDGVNDPALEPIRRFVRTHAIFSPELQALFRRLVPGEARRVTSLGVEGQNVTYADTYTVDAQATAEGVAGALPKFSTCDRWRRARRRIVQGRTQADISYLSGEPYTGTWWGA